VIAERHGVRKRPKRHRVLNHAGHAVKVGDAAERNNQVIIFELELAPTEPGANGNDLILTIDVLDLPHDQVGERAKPPNRRNDIGQTDRSRNDLREHRLVHPIVLAIDQSNASLLRTQELLQAPRSVNACEAAAGDEDLLWARARGPIEICAMVSLCRNASRVDQSGCPVIGGSEHL
jgi:hypothetical protein